MNMEKRFPRTQESSIHAEDIRLDNVRFFLMLYYSIQNWRRGGHFCYKNINMHPQT